MSFPPTLAALVLTTALLAACSEPPPATVSLYRAIQVGDLDQVKRHIYWGTDINQADAQGDSPLHVAVRRGRLIVSRALLESGSDANAVNGTGETPMRIALAHGKTQLAGVLVELGAADDPQLLLYQLIRAGVNDRDSLAFLVELGANIDAQDEAGDTPLHMAVADGRRLLVKRLIDLGADLDVRDASERTPLSIASENGDRHIVDLLRRFGAQAQSSAAAPQGRGNE